MVRVDAPKATNRDFINYFSKWENGKILLGTSWSWFALDIAFYGLGLNSSIILTTIGFGAPSKAVAARLGRQKTVWLNLKNISVGNLVISVAGLIPGYYACMALVDFVRTDLFVDVSSTDLPHPSSMLSLNHVVGPQATPADGLRRFDRYIRLHGFRIR